METNRYFYNDQAWSACQTVQGDDSLFHAILGTRADEAEEYFDKHSQFRRMRWATFLTYYKNEVMPSSVEDYLTKTWSAIDRYRHISVDDTLGLTNYISSIIAAERNVTIEEITLLATLENVKIVLLLSTASEAALVFEPNPEHLESFPIPNVDEEPTEVVVCLRGDAYSRLEIARDDSAATADRITEGTTTFRKIVPTTLDGWSKFRKGGSAGSKGVQFQVYLLTVAFLNSFRNKEGWRLSSENMDAEKFDDIVLECTEGATFIQCKYKENKVKKIGLEDFLSTSSKNSDFSLQKYLLSYSRLKERFVNVKNVIICTNADIQEKMLQFLNPEQANTESLLYTNDTSNRIYTFNQEIFQYLHDSNPQMDERIMKEFLWHLQLYVNYPPFDQLKKIIDTILPLTKYCNNSSDKITFSELYPKMMEWFQDTVGMHINDAYAKAMFAKIWQDKYCYKLEQYKTSFRRNNLNFNDPDQIFQVRYNGQCLLQLLEIYRAIESDKTKTLFLQSIDDDDNQELTVKAFEFPRNIYLIIVWDKSIESATMCNELRRVLGRYYYKKIILLGKHSNILARQIGPSVVIEIDVKFEDLSTITQKRLLNRKSIDFQGYRCNLRELLENQFSGNYNDVMKYDVLEKLVKGDDIKVGLPVKPLHEEIERYYINRQFTREMENQEADETYEEIYSEEDVYGVSDKFVIIENRGGMGKTTVLTHLTALIKKNHPQKWVVRIELNKYKDTLKEFLKRNEVVINIQRLLRSAGSKELESEFEDFVFSLDGKVVLILDAVDEISDDISPYLRIILSLFEQCREACYISKVFVASREHAVQALAEELNVTPFKLVPFGQTEYEDFFVRFWSAKLALDGRELSRCRLYAEAVVSKMGPWLNPDYTRGQQLVVVPLQLKMLGEIFQERGRFEIPEDWDGCREFVNGDGLRPNLPRKINMAKLFKMLIEKKGDFLIDEIDSSDRVANTKMLLRKYNEYFAYRKLL